MGRLTINSVDSRESELGGLSSRMESSPRPGKERHIGIQFQYAGRNNVIALKNCLRGDVAQLKKGDSIDS